MARWIAWRATVGSGARAGISAIAARRLCLCRLALLAALAGALAPAAHAADPGKVLRYAFPAA
jgi:hypothetical protein